MHLAQMEQDGDQMEPLQMDSHLTYAPFSTPPTWIVYILNVHTRVSETYGNISSFGEGWDFL